MLVHHTGAALWQGKKTVKEMAEVFYNAITACVNKSAGNVEDYLFAILHRWLSVDPAHRDSFLALTLPSSSLPLGPARKGVYHKKTNNSSAL